MANLLSLWRNFFSLFSARQFFLPTLAVFNSIGQIFYLLKTVLRNYRVTLATFFKVKICLFDVNINCFGTIFGAPNLAMKVTINFYLF